jgi:diadenosine tetraphosphatase ApaH/serine/threonine PP2A family protein phosphatase
MLIALLADIHGNREALSACLTHARARGANQFAFLGDYVGYGADPQYTVECVGAHVAKGAAAVLGNHDRAILDSSMSMNSVAQTAIAWTRDQLGRDARDFLKGLPLTLHVDDRLYVHADASDPAHWNYVLDGADAAASLNATTAQLIICGHVHVPALYGLSQTGKPIAFVPVAGAAIPLLPRRRWLAVLGAVGQPRDGSPAASYALLKVATRELTFERVPYDVEKAAAKIIAAGLPEVLAYRLTVGK